MRRFSIRFLMAFVLVSAVGLAALRNANHDLWAGMMLLIALAAVGVAVLGAIFLRGRERAWWIGFAFFSGGYLALTFVPWLSDIFRLQLGTTHLIIEIYGWNFQSPSKPDYEEYLRGLRAGHSLFVLLAGLVGGRVTTWFYGRRERAEAAVVYPVR